MLPSFQFAYFLMFSSKMADSTFLNFCSFSLNFLCYLLQGKHTLGKIPVIDEIVGDFKFDRVIRVGWSC